MTEKAPVKIGVLFSQTGPTSVTEKAHIQGVLVACEEINSGGGIGGRPLEPIIVNPAGDDRLFHEMATELMRQRINVIAGCCLSTSRKTVVPVIERFNGILLYPSVYEGFEYSPNVIYGGAVPNQVIVPLLEYLFTHHGKKIALIGSDTLYAREINRIVKEFLGESGGRLVREAYFPFTTELGQFKAMLRHFVDQHADAIVSTVVGQDSVTLYDAFSEVDQPGRLIPIASLTTTESELAHMKPKARVGHLSALPYFGSLATPQNEAFITKFRRRYGEDAIPGVYSEVCYSMVHLFADAVRETGETDTDAILPVLAGAIVRGAGGETTIDPENNHFLLRPMIGRSSEDGTFSVVWTSPQAIRPDPYLIAYDRSLVA